MGRDYTKIQALREAIIEMRKNGWTQKEIAEHYGFKDKYVVKEFLKRERRKEKKIEFGLTPRRPGRPPKNHVPSEKEKDYEIKRLKMENELLRDFLRVIGRK